MDPCNRGELLTRIVQENAANRTAAIKTRAQLCEHADRFIANRSSDGTQLCASNFLGELPSPLLKSDARTHRTPKHCLRNVSERTAPFCGGFGSAHASL